MPEQIVIETTLFAALCARTSPVHQRLAYIPEAAATAVQLGYTSRNCPALRAPELFSKLADAYWRGDVR